MRASGFTRLVTAALAATATLFGAQKAHARFWQAANQLSSVISPALSGSGAYKGSVEVMGVAGFGTSKLNHVELATSQGYQYNSWFYMGAGLGVDIVRSTLDDSDKVPGSDPTGYYPGSGSSWNPNDPRFGSKRTGVMIPVFTDFRFDIPMGGNGSTFFIDLRLGASWMVGSRYIQTTGGYLSNQTQFYLRPAIGARFPISSSNPKQAINIGVAYLLLTSGNNYWYYTYNTQSFNALGATVSFEW